MLSPKRQMTTTQKNNNYLIINVQNSCEEIIFSKRPNPPTRCTLGKTSGPHRLSHDHPLPSRKVRTTFARANLPPRVRVGAGVSAISDPDVQSRSETSMRRPLASRFMRRSSAERRRATEEPAALCSRRDASAPNDPRRARSAHPISLQYVGTRRPCRVALR
jgi:hypothetical protein